MRSQFENSANGSRADEDETNQTHAFTDKSTFNNQIDQTNTNLIFTHPVPSNLLGLTTSANQVYENILDDHFEVSRQTVTSTEYSTIIRAGEATMRQSIDGDLASTALQQTTAPPSYSDHNGRHLKEAINYSVSKLVPASCEFVIAGIYDKTITLHA